MICLQLCNYSWPRFVLLCDEGIAGVRLFLINLDECDLKTDALVWAQIMNWLTDLSPNPTFHGYVLFVDFPPNKSLIHKVNVNT